MIAQNIVDSISKIGFASIVNPASARREAVAVLSDGFGVVESVRFTRCFDGAIDDADTYCVPAFALSVREVHTGLIQSFTIPAARLHESLTNDACVGKRVRISRHVTGHIVKHVVVPALLH
jgi:hypothetical protein